MGAAFDHPRLILTASSFARLERERIVPRRVGYLRLRWCSIVWTQDGVRNLPAWNRQTLRPGVHRYNAADWPGLRISNRRVLEQTHGAASKPELAELVDAGPDPAVHGVVRWARSIMLDELRRRFGVALPRAFGCKVLASSATANCRQAPPPKGRRRMPRRPLKNFASTGRRKSPTAPKAADLAPKIRAETTVRRMTDRN